MALAPPIQLKRDLPGQHAQIAGREHPATTVIVLVIVMTAAQIAD
jgi:hypothetical protein